MNQRETIGGFSWRIVKLDDGDTEYFATCLDLKLTASGDTYRNLKKSINKVLDDLLKQIQKSGLKTLKEYAENLRGE